MTTLTQYTHLTQVILFRPLHYDQQASKQGAGSTHALASVLIFRSEPSEVRKLRIQVCACVHEDEVYAISNFIDVVTQYTYAHMHIDTKSVVICHF